ncbi:MAG: hypothetical protein KDA66_07885, partial [Planctomycetaceae bacterium]|nr:hypothetical protein [Planctomycetaceae bacterium]
MRDIAVTDDMPPGQVPVRLAQDQQLLSRQFKTGLFHKTVGDMWRRRHWGSSRGRLLRCRRELSVQGLDSQIAAAMSPHGMTGQQPEKSDRTHTAATDQRVNRVPG